MSSMPCVAFSGAPPLAQWPREAQLMSVRVGDVEVALAPLGVARREVGFQTLSYGVPMESIHVGDVEDHATPP